MRHPPTPNYHLPRFLGFLEKLIQNKKAKKSSKIFFSDFITNLVHTRHYPKQENKRKLNMKKNQNREPLTKSTKVTRRRPLVLKPKKSIPSLLRRTSRNTTSRDFSLEPTTQDFEFSVPLAEEPQKQPPQKQKAPDKRRRSNRTGVVNKRKKREMELSDIKSNGKGSQGKKSIRKHPSTFSPAKRRYGASRR